MSYENPLRIIDKQSGQAFRNMQKSIADTTISYQKGFENEFIRRRKLNAEIVKDVDAKKTLAMQSGMSATENNPAIDATAAIQKQVDLYGDALLVRPSDRTDVEKALVKNVPLIGSITKNMVTNMALAAEDFNKKYTLGLGMEGGIYTGTKNYKAGLIMFGMGQIPGRREIKYEMKKGTLTALTYLYDEKGKPLMNETENPPAPYPGIANSDINNLFGIQGIPNESPNLQKQVDLSKAASDYNNMDSEIYMGQPILKNVVNGEVRYYKQPSKDQWRETATPLATSRIDAMGAAQAIIYANDILKIDPPEEVVAKFNDENKAQKKRIVEAYVNRMQELTPELQTNQSFGSFDQKAYIAQQKAIEAEKKAKKVPTGKDAYRDFANDPVGLYEEYMGESPNFNKETKIMTIYAKQQRRVPKKGEAPNKDIVYDFKKKAERNEFFLDMLRDSPRNVGNSAANKLFQKEFEEAMRKDTAWKFNDLNPNRYPQN
tara:strand:- start:5761 stop:7224 length:1464 start_codon:yes stop_codon:yes gene_type:complete